MPTLVELQESLETKSAELEKLADQVKTADDPEALLKQAEAIDGEMDAIKAQIEKIAQSAARATELAGKAAAAKSFLNDPTSNGGVPFSGKITPSTQQADATKSLKDWLQCVGIAGSVKSNAHEQRVAAERLAKVYKSDFNDWSNIKAALSETSGITGGYVAPPEYSTDLLKVSIEESVFASRARQIQMGGKELHLPMLNQTRSTTSGQTAFTGGMVAYWTGEAATRSETEPDFKQVTLTANELSGYTAASRNILADNGVALEQMLQTLIQDTCKWYLDYNCLNGDGKAKPMGVLSSPSLLTSPRGTSGKIKLADVTGMLAKLLPQSFSKAFFIAGIDALPEIVTLVNASGNPTYVNAVGTGYDKANLFGPLMLFNRPVYFTEKLPALGTAGDLLLVDPSFYLLGTRLQVEIMASDAPGFLKNQMYWRFVARMDGQPWIDAPFTLQDGTRKVSPFVALAA